MDDEQVIAELRAAFVSESTAAVRYAYQAAVAEIEGCADAVILFHELMQSATCVAHGHLDLLRQLAEAGPGVDVGDTRDNLAHAMTRELQAWTERYPALVAAAFADGRPDVASWGQTVTALSRAHVGKMEAALRALQEDPMVEATR